MSLVRRFARPLLASSFIVSGIDRLRDPDSAQHLATGLDLAAKTTPQLSALRGQEKLIGQALAASQVAAGTLFALGRFPRLSSTILLATGSINSYIEYRASEVETKEAKSARRHGALRNISLLGAISLASVDTDGSPSLAWRAAKLSDRVTKKTGQLKADVMDVAHEAQKKAEDIFSA